MKKVFVLLVTLVLCSCGTAPQVDEVDQSIIGGVPTSGDPAVVAILGVKPGADAGSLCTGTVISPTVILTAAHCVHPQLVGQGATYTVYTGSDLTDPNDRCPCLEVASTHHHPLFNANNPVAGYDIGIVVLAQPIDVTPVPYRVNPLTSDMTGKPVRIIGYGLNKGVKREGAGVKRVATVNLRSYNAKFVRTGQWGKGICNGDSGGPVLLKINGKETVIGVNSFGNMFCFGQSSSGRVDIYSNFIQQYL